MSAPPGDEHAEGQALPYCVRHPDVETGLTCGRCSAAICPRCLVHTPGGIRCPDCARLRRPPMYELSTGDYLRAAAAALVLAVPLGILGAILLAPQSVGGLFTMVIALAAGAGAGTLVATAMSRLTHEKRGLPMQLIAVAGLLLAGGIRTILTDLDPSLIVRDTVGVFAVLIAIAVAWNRLK